jgi:DNA repair protein RadC
MDKNNLGINAITSEGEYTIPSTKTSKKLLSENNSISKYLRSHKEAGDFLKNSLSSSDEENLYMICLTNECKILSFEMIQSGDEGSVFIDTDVLIEKAKAQKAKKVILAHNHISKLMKYSSEDFYSTEKLVAYFSASSIILMEHFVVSGGKYHGILYDLSDTDNWKLK